MSEDRLKQLLHEKLGDKADRTYERFLAWITNIFNRKVNMDHFTKIEECDYDELVIVKDIDVDLCCPHHLMPVECVVHIGYLPDGYIIGLSKLARVAEEMARPVTQEEYTQELANLIYKHLNPKWCMVVVEGKHTCMRCRGVRSKRSIALTSTICGEKSSHLKQEFLQLIGYG